jgi:hydrogenase expression/formation protein HypC
MEGEGGRNMCLAVPHRIEKILDSRRVIARAGSLKVEARTDLIDSVNVGDVVLVHAGFIIEKCEEKEGQELEELWKEVLNIAGKRQS